MKMARKVMVLGACSIALGAGVQDRTRAQDWRELSVIFVGTLAWGMISGAKHAQAEQRAKAEPKELKLPSPAMTAPKLFKLVEGNTITTATHCISFVEGLCSPCDLQGERCNVRFSESVIRY